MARLPRYKGLDLTVHQALPRMFAGYTGATWFKLYGFFTAMAFILCYTYTRYLELFDDIESKSAIYQTFVLWFSGIPVLLAVGAVLGFFWWSAEQLVRVSRWQLKAPRFWRWYWMIVQVFFTWVLVDPMDNIWPAMSRKGLFPAFNFYYIFDSDVDKFVMFQWGVFLLWLLFWVLVAAVSWVHISESIAKFWFYTNRTQRYAVSVLTGLRETARVQQREPVTLDYPRERTKLPHVFRGIPRLNVDELSLLDARAILAADASGAIVTAPDQETVLFIDLGRYDFAPELAELRGVDGKPLLRFTDYWAQPTAGREGLIIPLKPRAGETVLPAEEVTWIK